MATIGTLGRLVNGNYRGRVKTLVHDLVITMESNTEPRQSDDAPTHLVFAQAGGEAVQIGAAWERTMERGDRAGEAFFALTMDDPSFPAPLHCNAFPDADREGVYRLDWRRAKPKAQEPAQAA